MIATIDAPAGSVTERYCVHTDEVGIWIEHVSVASDGVEALSGIACLMIEPGAVRSVIAALQRAEREMRG